MEDYNNWSKEDIQKEIEKLKEDAKEYKRKSDFYNATQLALKTVLNQTYGAFAQEHFILFSNAVANAITAAGRDLTQMMNATIEDYFYNKFHNDTELHEKLDVASVEPIPHDDNNIVVVYGDTDSCSKDTIIETENGKITIEQWYNDNIINGSNGSTLQGHESVKCYDKILNYNNKLEYVPVKRIIRHKVKKEKWCLKTSSGKEIIITNDHSMIVFRDNQKIEVKPSQILLSDKILTIN